MRSALITEYRKFVTTRMWWGMLITMVLYMSFLGAVMAFSFTVPAALAVDGTPSTQIPPLDLALNIYSLAGTLGYVFPLLIGTLAVTGEFKHQTITPTLLAEPRRSVMLAAKLVAALPVGLLYGVVGTASVVAPGATVLALMGEDPLLTEPEVLRTIGYLVVALTLWAVVGVGLGAVMTNQVTAIVVVLVFTQLVEPVLRVGLGFIDGADQIARWLPGAAGDAIAGSSLYDAMGTAELLSRWQGILVLVGYGLILALIGRFTALRRDIT